MIIEQGKTNWKYISLVVVLAFLIGGILLWRYGYLPTKEIKPTPIEPAEARPPEQVVSQFYQCYIRERLNNGLSFDSVINSCNALEEDYKQSLFGEEVRLVDPVIWVSDYSEETDVQIEKVDIEGNTASVIVGFLPTSFWLDHKVEVSVGLINNEWKIRNIKGYE